MASSGNTEPGGEKAVVMLRVALSLKFRLQAWARERGLTLNAAAITLLDRALAEDEKPPRSG